MNVQVLLMYKYLMIIYIYIQGQIYIGADIYTVADLMGSGGSDDPPSGIRPPADPKGPPFDTV